MPEQTEQRNAATDLNRFADAFSGLAEQANEDVGRWNDTYRASGKRGAELTDHDVAIIAAGRAHDQTILDVTGWLAEAQAQFYPDPSTREPMCQLGDGDIYHGRDGWEPLMMAVIPIDEPNT